MGLFSTVAGRRALRFPAALLTILFLLLSAGSLFAAEKFKPGDEIEYFTLNKWWPGRVLDIGPRGEVLIKYDFAGGVERVVKPAELRFAYEAGALTKPRPFSDASGKFRITAVVVSIEGDQVTLRKPDKSEVTLPITRLSKVDQSYLNTLKKNIASSGAGSAKGGAPGDARTPTGPPLPETVVFEGSGGGGRAAFGGTDLFGGGGGGAAGAGGRAALTADAVPAFLTLKEGGAGFRQEEFFDKLTAVIGVGGKDGWILACLENQRPGEAGPGRLLWCSLTTKKIAGEQTLPPGETVFDYHPPSHRLLTYSTPKADGSGWGTPTLTVWEVLPKDKEVKPVVRWSVDPGERNRWPREPWARFASGKVVVQRHTSHEIAGWDIEARRQIYRIEQQSFFVPNAVLSPGRKYLLVPEDNAVRIFEAENGKLVSTLPAQQGSSAVAVSADGTKAAVLNRNSLAVWELTDANAPPKVFEAPAIGTPFSANLQWVDDKHLLADSTRNKILFSLEHEVPLWVYEFNMEAIAERDGQRLVEVVDEHLVYAVSLRSGSESGFAVGAVKLPGPKVNEVAATLDRESLMVLKPGSAVRLDVRAGEHTARVQAALEKEIAKNGWTVSPDATAVIIAEMKRGENQTVTYRSGGFGFGPGARPERTETVSVTPYISSLRIEVGGEVAWQSGTSTGAPALVRLKEGESVQAEVDKWQQPNPGFFDGADIPAGIIDPSKAHGLGKTSVTSRGLEAR